MPEDKTQNNQTDQAFVRKAVETPILGSAEREQISGAENFSASGGWAAGFYKANKIYFWAIFAGLIIISILVYFAFKKSAPATITEANVSIKVEVQDTVPSGSEA